MRRTSLSIAAASVLAAGLWAQTDPSGHWEGTFRPGEQEVGLSLDLAKNAKSEWIASMGVPGDKVTGLVVMDLVVSGNSVKFTAVELMMSKFDLTLGTDGKLAGTISGRMGSMPVAFKRTGEAKVELMAPSPAVSKALEGDWEGTLQTPGRPFQIVFHFKNRADGTVAATIDTPDTGGIGLPLNDVKQTDRAVQVGIRIAHAIFRGTLSADGAELAGEFAHEDQGMPLTLKKRQ